MTQNGRRQVGAAVRGRRRPADRRDDAATAQRDDRADEAGERRRPLRRERSSRGAAAVHAHLRRRGARTRRPQSAHYRRSPMKRTHRLSDRDRPASDGHESVVVVIKLVYDGIRALPVTLARGRTRLGRCSATSAGRAPGRRPAAPGSPSSSRTGTLSAPPCRTCEPGLSPTTTKPVFFDTEPVTLPPRVWIASVGLVAGEAGQRAGDHHGQPFQRPRARRRPRSSAIRTPAARHFADDLAVPVDREPLLERSRRWSGRRRRPRTAPRSRGRVDRVDRAELPGQRLRRGRADVPDRQRDQHPPQRPLLGLGEVVQQLDRVAAQAAVLVDEERRARRAASASRANRSPSSAMTLARRAAPAPPCSRAPRCRSAPRPARWNTRSRSCAGQRPGVGAADVDVALLGRGERRAAGRAVRSASRTRARRPGAGRPPGRAPRGSRRRPCAAPPCRRSARPCARPRGRCAGWPARPSSRPPAPAPAPRTA